MNTSQLRLFIEEIMDIRPGMAGLGGASSAIIGTTGTEGVAAEKLRRDALAFANELTQSPSDHERLIELAKTLEGSLLTVKMVSGISDVKLEKLISALHSLIE